jgi:hypothetical protein
MTIAPTQRQLVLAKQRPAAYVAALTLCTPSGNSVEYLTVPAHPLTIAGAVIRFADRHGIGACMVETTILYTTPVQVAA